jgi:O2-independent ubiquinone biosynthesis accessory factor UbiT
VPTLPLAPLRLTLRALPDRLHAAGLAALASHLLRGQALAARLPELDGCRVAIEIEDLGCRLGFAVRGRGLAACDPGGADVRIRGGFDDFWRLATRAEDPDTLFFQRRLSIEGDTERGLMIKNLLDALEFDWRAHVAAVLGPVPAGVLEDFLVGTAGALARRPRPTTRAR